MTTRTRSTLFWLFVVLFFVGGTSLILYVSGYRLNLETGKIEKVGGTFIKTNTRNYEVTLSGHNYKTTRYPVTSELFVSDLTPGTYTMETKKDHFLPWKKEFTVLPSLVTSFKSILLLPDTFSPETLFTQKSPTETFTLSPHNDTLIFPDEASPKTTLYDLSTGEALRNLKEQDIKNITWLSNNTSFFYEQNFSQNTILVSGEKTLRIQNAFKKSLVALYSASKITIRHIYPHPFEPKLIIHANVGVYIFDPIKLESVLLTDIDPITLTLNNSSVYFLDTEGKLYSENLITKNVNTDVRIPLLAIKKTPHEDWHLLLSPDGKTNAIWNTTTLALYIEMQNTNTFSPISTKASSPLFSLDSRKLAYLEETSPIIYWLDQDEELQKKIGQKDVLSPKLPITKLTWYKDNSHLFGYTGSKELHLFDIDNRIPINSTRIDGAISHYIYNSDTNILFYLHEGKLLKLDFNFPTN